MKFDYMDRFIKLNFNICFKRFNFIQHPSDSQIRYQYSSYARYQNLNNSLDIYVKTASLITYRIMQICFIHCSISNVLILSSIMIYTLIDMYWDKFTRVTRKFKCLNILYQTIIVFKNKTSTFHINRNQEIKNFIIKIYSEHRENYAIEINFSFIFIS